MNRRNVETKTSRHQVMPSSYIATRKNVMKKNGKSIKLKDNKEEANDKNKLIIFCFTYRYKNKINLYI